AAMAENAVKGREQSDQQAGEHRQPPRESADRNGERESGRRRPDREGDDRGAPSFHGVTSASAQQLQSLTPVTGIFRAGSCSASRTSRVQTKLPCSSVLRWS